MTIERISSQLTGGNITINHRKKYETNIIMHDIFYARVNLQFWKVSYSMKNRDLKVTAWGKHLVTLTREVENTFSESHESAFGNVLRK